MATVRWFIDNQLYSRSSPDLYDVTNTTSVDPLTEDTIIRSSFHIKKVRREDLASYTCQAINNVVGQGEKMTNQSTTLIISRECFFFIICINYGISYKGKIIYFYRKATSSRAEEHQRATRHYFDLVKAFFLEDLQIVSKISLK